MADIKVRTAPVVATEDIGDVITGKKRERDETQQAIDNELARAVKAYNEAGAAKVPTQKRARVRFEVSPKDKTVLKEMIRRAARFHKVDALFFADAVNEAGEAVVTVTVGPQTDKKH